MIISCFSGIGGLEGTAPASLFCEFDPKAQLILEKRYPTAKIHDDVRTLRPPKADAGARISASEGTRSST